MLGGEGIGKRKEKKERDRIAPAARPTVHASPPHDESGKTKEVPRAVLIELRGFPVEGKMYIWTAQQVQQD